MLCLFLYKINCYLNFMYIGFFLAVRGLSIDDAYLNIKK